VLSCSGTPRSTSPLGVSTAPTPVLLPSPANNSRTYRAVPAGFFICTGCARSTGVCK
jgi:hypothetical protein